MAGRNHLTSPNLGGLDRFAAEPEKVEKPWGHELIWAKTDSFAGKILFVRAGESLSLQFAQRTDGVLVARLQPEAGRLGTGTGRQGPCQHHHAG